MLASVLDADAADVVASTSRPGPTPPPGLRRSGARYPSSRIVLSGGALGFLPALSNYVERDMGPPHAGVRSVFGRIAGLLEPLGR